MTDIIQKDNPVLRKRAAEIETGELGGERISALAEQMSKVLAREHHGVALAAPQIGESLRMFIVSGTLFARRDNKGEIVEKHPDLVFINPRLTNTSKETAWVEEGCLSVEGLQGRVERALEATLEAYDATGKPFTLKGAGLLAQIFQHEIDHLNGVLYTDKAKDVYKLSEKTET
ncbi:peptide deformylase [Candidatus Wolfebacteria bacterium]|nr:peptide deformylase [Candidatus Wolfebacteria bacterium]